MRGKATFDIDAANRLRITPAYAGKSDKLRLVLNCQWDHPRVCGEKTGTAWRWLMVTGSPPRMRGKAQRLLNHSDPLRITPAYAGKRLAGLLEDIREQDHPRVCGEKSPRGHCLCYPIGSPPRMRGKASFFRCLCPGDGITPAYAGKSPASHRTFSKTRDHPRVCGEKTKKIP